MKKIEFYDKWEISYIGYYNFSLNIKKLYFLDYFDVMSRAKLVLIWKKLHYTITDSLSTWVIALTA